MIGIGFAAGGVGAVISVLTRLGRLEVDYKAPRGRVRLAAPFDRSSVEHLGFLSTRWFSPTC